MSNGVPAFKPYRRSHHHGRHLMRALRHFFACGAAIFLLGSAFAAVSALFRHTSERMPFWRMAFGMLAASLVSLLLYAALKALHDWRHARVHARHKAEKEARGDD
jgi:H+/Cl- antiporter ClcA